MLVGAAIQLASFATPTIALASALTIAQIGLQVVGAGLSLHDRLSPNPAQDMLDTIIQQQFDQYNKLNRHASGGFNASDVQNIRQANQGRLNRTASNLAQQGLGTSEAGADFLQQQQQAPFIEAQRSAQLALPQAAQVAFNLASPFIGDDSFAQDISSLAETLGLLEKLTGKPDPDVDGALGDLIKLHGLDDKKLKGIGTGTPYSTPSSV